MTTIARSTLHRLRARGTTDFEEEPTLDGAYEGFEISEAEPLPPPPMVLIMPALQLPIAELVAECVAGAEPEDELGAFGRDFSVTEEAFFSAGDAMAALAMEEETLLVDLADLLEPAPPPASAPPASAPSAVSPVAQTVAVAEPFPRRAPRARPERRWLLAAC